MLADRGSCSSLGTYPFALDVKGGEVDLVLPSMPKGEIVGIMANGRLSLMAIYMVK